MAVRVRVDGPLTVLGRLGGGRWLRRRRRLGLGLRLRLGLGLGLGLGLRLGLGLGLGLSGRQSHRVPLQSAAA